MKNKTLQIGRVQSFIFNIIIFVGLLFLGLNYFLPEYFEIEVKKNNLLEVQKKYTSLTSSGITFEDFTKMHSTLGKKIGLDKNIYLKNVLNEFTKEDYEKNFINYKGGTYRNFIESKKREIKIKKNKIEESGVSDNLKKILPYYTEDSSLSDKSLTDFKFINYIETLLSNFRLDYTNSIGISNLEVEKSIESDYIKGKENTLEGKIYNFKLNLGIVGKKKNIIDFIHYLENVGNIKIGNNGDVKIKKLDLASFYFDNEGIKTKNNFNNISGYFLGNKDIYNNLVVDIKSIKFNDYLDSSDLPTHYNKGDTFIGFIKNDKNQIDEKFEVDLVLKFYVKGLPIYKIKDYIKNVNLKYRKLTSTINSGIKYGDKNKSKLEYIQRSSLKKLKEYNFYLQSIKKEIKDLQNSKKLKTEMGNVYKNAQSYNDIFEKIDKGLDVNLKKLSENLYKKYKKIK